MHVQTNVLKRHLIYKIWWLLFGRQAPSAKLEDRHWLAWKPARTTDKHTKTFKTTKVPTNAGTSGGEIEEVGDYDTLRGGHKSGGANLIVASLLVVTAAVMIMWMEHAHMTSHMQIIFKFIQVTGWKSQLYLELKFISYKDNNKSNIIKIQNQTS